MPINGQMDKEVVHINNGRLPSPPKKSTRDCYVMLSEINQTEKDKYHIISFVCGM